LSDPVGTHGHIGSSGPVGSTRSFLRQYEPHECGTDGYPFAWHRATPMLGEVPDPIVLAIKDYIREQAGYRCQRCGHPYRTGEHGNGEWSLCDEQCHHGGPLRGHLRGDESKTFANSTDGGGEAGGWVHVGYLIEAAWRILTVHHLDEDKANCRWWNLLAACQRCHLSLQRRVVMDRPWHFEHKDYFKPFAAGFYSWKYLQEDLTREETMSRLDELLALEHRFTQDALPI